jgi:hypothetical protein
MTINTSDNPNRLNIGTKKSLVDWVSSISPLIVRLYPKNRSGFWKSQERLYSLFLH